MFPDSSRPLISIITPSLNQARYLEQAVLSVRTQGYGAYEHIIIDGGSSDGTLDLLRSLNSGSRLKWISEPDRGQSHAFNKGLAMAKGEIVGWLNADDTLLPGAFDAALEAFDGDSEVHWVHGDGFWLSSDGWILGRRTARPCGLRDLLLDGMIVTQPSLFIQRDTLQDLQGLDEEIQTCMDYDLCLRIAHRWPGAYIPRAMATRRLHLDTKTETMGPQFFDDTLKTLDKFFGQADLSSAVRSQERLAYARPHMVEGYRRFRQGEFHQARQMLLQFVRLRAPRLANRDVLASLILILESSLGLSWIKPGNSKKRAARLFRSRHGLVQIDFRDPALGKHLMGLL